MNKLELLEILNSGENSYIEFKEESIKPKDLAEEFIAFANSEGGTVLLGIADDGTIKGIKAQNIEEKNSYGFLKQAGVSTMTFRLSLIQVLRT